MPLKFRRSFALIEILIVMVLLTLIVAVWAKYPQLISRFSYEANKKALISKIELAKDLSQLLHQDVDVVVRQEKDAIYTKIRLTGKLFANDKQNKILQKVLDKEDLLQPLSGLSSEDETMISKITFTFDPTGGIQTEPVNTSSNYYLLPLHNPSNEKQYCVLTIAPATKNAYKAEADRLWPKDLYGD